MPQKKRPSDRLRKLRALQRESSRNRTAAQQPIDWSERDGVGGNGFKPHVLNRAADRLVRLCEQIHNGDGRQWTRVLADEKRERVERLLIKLDRDRLSLVHDRADEKESVEFLDLCENSGSLALRIFDLIGDDEFEFVVERYWRLDVSQEEV